MRQKNRIFQVSLICLMFFLFSHIYVRAIDVFASENSPNSEPSLNNNEKQFSGDIQTLQKTALQQRKDLIENMLNLVKTKEFLSIRKEIAIEILGQIRAIEATDILLNMVDYHLPISGMYSPTTDPEGLRYRYPVVNALINIKPSYDSVINKIADVDDISCIRCYVAILIGIEGEDVCRYILKKAVEKEHTERKLSRLNSALNMFNKDFPDNEKKETKKDKKM